MNNLRTVFSAVLPILLCTALLGTIYLTLFDWQWLAFLSGIFVAAVLALSSRATHAEWRVARKSKQLEKLKEKLSGQTMLYQRSERLLADTNARIKLLWNSVPELILYVDADQTCRHHNKVFARALGLNAVQIDGQLLRKVMGDASYLNVKSSIELALNGEQVRLRQVQRSKDGGIQHYDTRYIPHVGANNKVLGFYALLIPSHGHQSRDLAAQMMPLVMLT